MLNAEDFQDIFIFSIPFILGTMPHRKRNFKGKGAYLLASIHFFQWNFWSSWRFLRNCLSVWVQARAYSSFSVYLRSRDLINRPQLKRSPWSGNRKMWKLRNPTLHFSFRVLDYKRGLWSCSTTCICLYVHSALALVVFSRHLMSYAVFVGFWDTILWLEPKLAPKGVQTRKWASTSIVVSLIRQSLCFLLFIASFKYLRVVPRAPRACREIWRQVSWGDSFYQ